MAVSEPSADALVTCSEPDVSLHEVAVGIVRNVMSLTMVVGEAEATTMEEDTSVSTTPEQQLVEVKADNMRIRAKNRDIVQKMKRNINCMEDMIRLNKIANKCNDEYVEYLTTGLKRTRDELEEYRDAIMYIQRVAKKRKIDPVEKETLQAYENTGETYNY